MIDPIREYILAAEGAVDDSLEAEQFDEKQENEVSFLLTARRCPFILALCTDI